MFVPCLGMQPVTSVNTKYRRFRSRPRILFPFVGVLSAAATTRTSTVSGAEGRTVLAGTESCAGSREGVLCVCVSDYWLLFKDTGEGGDANGVL